MSIPQTPPAADSRAASLSELSPWSSPSTSLQNIPEAAIRGRVVSLSTPPNHQSMIERFRAWVTPRRPKSAETIREERLPVPPKIREISPRDPRLGSRAEIYGIVSRK